MPSAQAIPSAFPGGVIATHHPLINLAPVLNKIQKFNSIELPRNYPTSTYIYQIKIQELTAADYYLLSGEIDKAKAEYDRRDKEFTQLDRLNALRYAALSGKNNALKNCVSLFKIRTNEISLIDLFTILHYAALGGNTQLVEQAIEWIHAHHQNYNRFWAIADMLPKRIAISAVVSGIATAFIFVAIAASASNGIAPIIILGLLSLAFLIVNAIACGYSPIKLLRKFPGFGKESRQALNASAGIALIAAIESDNPQVIQSISSRIINSFSISYPIPPERSSIPNPYGVNSVQTEDYFHPSYTKHATHKTAATQAYTDAITGYHSSCLYRRHPVAPIQNSDQVTELRIFSNPQRQPVVSSKQDTASPRVPTVTNPTSDTPSLRA